jgi:hypothetical protein
MRQKIMSIEEQEVHSDALRILNEAGVHYVVSGAVALGHYTGLWRSTKDLDLFLVRTDLTSALTVLATHGYTVETQSSHWLANARKGKYYVDLIHGFGGWRAPIDEEWYDRGYPAVVLGHPVRVSPVEELIWIKAYVAHRERFDGADVLHLIQACHQTLNWNHLLSRFGECSDLLLFYLALYEFAYPGRRTDIPGWVKAQLIDRVHHTTKEPASAGKICRGTLIDRFSFLADIQDGWVDARIPWAEVQGWSEHDVDVDRAEALRMVEDGRVRPERAA